MNPPRALRSPVMAMARPRRPAAEATAVRAAAALVEAETGITSAQGQGREIARRVIDLLLDDTRNDLAAMLAPLAGDPIAMLAFGEGFGAVDDLAARFRDRMLANFGVAIAPVFQQVVNRRDAAAEVASSLCERYARHLRSMSEVREMA